MKGKKIARTNVKVRAIHCCAKRCRRKLVISDDSYNQTVSPASSMRKQGV